ncbi:hypothetical protein [Streptomyces sp. NPDC089799]|uniref:hypothetical protein n=1 Tax=Streptomyces sp. NPDC089799 TaxID=3155066 RepID=UPI00341F180D
MDTYLLDGLLDHDEEKPIRPLLGEAEARALMMLLPELDVAGQPEEIRDAARELRCRIGTRLAG